MMQTFYSLQRMALVLAAIGFGTIAMAADSLHLTKKSATQDATVNPHWTSPATEVVPRPPATSPATEMSPTAWPPTAPPYAYATTLCCDGSIPGYSPMGWPRGRLGCAYHGSFQPKCYDYRREFDLPWFTSQYTARSASQCWGCRTPAVSGGILQQPHVALPEPPRAGR